MKQIYVLVVLATKFTRNPYAKVLTYDDWSDILMEGKNSGDRDWETNTYICFIINNLE